MPKIELDELGEAHVKLLMETRGRAVAEAERKFNEGLEIVLRASNHEWPGTDLGVRKKEGKMLLVWGDELTKEKGAIAASGGPPEDTPPY